MRIPPVGKMPSDELAERAEYLRRLPRVTEEQEQLRHTYLAELYRRMRQEKKRAEKTAAA